MADNQERLRQYANVPIPTYDEAVAGGLPERQGLLESDFPSTYHAPTAESARSSIDSDLGLPEVARDGDEARRHVEELDYLDPSDLDTSRRSPRPYHRSRLRSKFSISRSWSQLSATLTSIRLPSFRSLYTPLTNNSPNRPRSSRFSWLQPLVPRCSIPEQYRISAPTAARLCGLFAIMVLIYVLFAFDLFPGARRFGAGRYDPESVRSFVLKNIDRDNIKQSLLHLASYDHVAGTKGDLFMAEWMEERWRQDGYFDQLALLSYSVFLNYPGERVASIVLPEDAQWTAALEEDRAYIDRVQTLAWHGYSQSGDVRGHLIYANAGSKEDFAYLQEKGIVTKGSVALVKSHGSEAVAAFKVKYAFEAGCVGVLIYSDPSDIDSAGSWHLPEDLVERDSVALTRSILGDPLTPGWASTENAKRISKENNPALPKIPSLPLAWRDAKHLLSALQNHGLPAKDDWRHGTDDSMKLWFTGNVSTDAKPSPEIILKNNNEEEPQQKIWNLHGIIEGIEQPDRKIIVGTHHDSWCFGAADPGSGVAVVTEIIRVFGELRQLKPSWRPLRTIEFVSWDASKFNLAGSTEYVEDNLEYLQANGIGYINVDVGVSGSELRLAGSPIYQRALTHVLGRIADPKSQGAKTLGNIFDDRARHLDALGVESDHVAFQNMAGVSAIDIGFRSTSNSFPEGSCHDTFEWMEEFGDPGFEYHNALAQMWSLLILELSDSPLLPLDARAYSNTIREYILALERDSNWAYAQQHGLPTASAKQVEEAVNFTLYPLVKASDALDEAAMNVHRFEEVWSANVLGSGGFETRPLAFQRLDYNDRLTRLEKDLLEAEGIPGRSQYKHVITGPQQWNGRIDSFFPAVRDAFENGQWTEAQQMIEKTAQKIGAAAANLVR